MLWWLWLPGVCGRQLSCLRTLTPAFQRFMCRDLLYRNVNLNEHKVNNLETHIIITYSYYFSNHYQASVMPQICLLKLCKRRGASNERKGKETDSKSSLSCWVFVVFQACKQFHWLHWDFWSRSTEQNWINAISYPVNSHRGNKRRTKGNCVNRTSERAKKGV